MAGNGPFKIMNSKIEKKEKEKQIKRNWTTFASLSTFLYFWFGFVFFFHQQAFWKVNIFF